MLPALFPASAASLLAVTASLLATISVDAAVAPHPLSYYVSEPIPAKVAFQVSVKDLPKVSVYIAASMITSNTYIHP